MQALVALPRCFAEILCPDFGFGSLREVPSALLKFHGNHQSITAKMASSVRKLLANHSCSIMRYCLNLKGLT